MKSNLWRITSCVLDVALLRDLTTFLSPLMQPLISIIHPTPFLVCMYFFLVLDSRHSLLPFVCLFSLVLDVYIPYLLNYYFQKFCSFVSLEARVGYG